MLLKVGKSEENQSLAKEFRGKNKRFSIQCSLGVNRYLIDFKDEQRPSTTTATEQLAHKRKYSERDMFRN